jgi:hypothetical protein
LTLRGFNGGAHLGEAAFGGRFGDRGAEKLWEIYFLDEFGREFPDE